MKKIVSFVLALLLVLSSANIYAISTQDNLSNNLDINDKKAEAIYENDKVKSLILQSNGRIDDEDTRSFMIELDPMYFSNFGRMVPGKELYTDLGLKEQIDFGNKANEFAINQIKNSGIELNVLNRFNILMIGFSAEMTFKDAKLLAGLDFVKKIIIQNTIEKPVENTVDKRLVYTSNTSSLRNANSRDLIGNKNIYSKYKGQGKIVAVIDSGFDPNHEAFYLTEEGKEKARYSEDDINKLKNENLLERGFYINEKIPFAYNYFPGTNPEKIKQKSEKSHGQHVAGTVAANHVKVNLGEEEIDLVGVAPEAQLALMRVFADDMPGTSPDIYVKALEDCVVLRVDAVNMSLGSVAGDSTTIFPDAEKLFERLEEAGCVVAVAAGNETAFGANMGFKPRAEYPDYGILGDPAAAKKSLAVASIENGFTIQQYFKSKNKNGNIENLFLDWSRNQKGEIVEPEYDKEFELVYLGLGREEDYENKNINGKVALIERGDITFEQKVKIAKSHGVKAILIYNHEEGGDEFVGMSGAGNHEVPVASLYYSTGLKLKENAETVIFKKGRMSFYNPLSGQISKFSSFGLTADGSFKPDITAPGGNIYSLGNNNTYNVQNGTSMATPHVAGGLALVNSMIDEKYPNVIGKDRYQLIRNLVMSTAEVHYFNKAATSPRRQGAGVMNLQNALNTKAILIGDENETKLFNKNASNNERLTFKIKNLSDEAISYDYKTTIVADQVSGSYLTYYSKWLKDVNNGTVTLDSKETKEITVNIDTSEFADELKSKMPNGYFIDGFIIFESQNEPTISIPFITFVGDLDRVQIVESSVYDLAKNNKIPYYWNENANSHIADSSIEGEVGNSDFTHLFTNIGEKTEILGQHKDFTNKVPKFYEKNVISPNKDNYADNFFIKYTMIRSGNVSINVYKLDENGNKNTDPLVNILENEMIVKNYGSVLLGNSYYIDIPFPSSNMKLDDGEYVLSFSSYRNADKKLDDVDIKFVVDTKKPSINNFNIENNILSFDAYDENNIRDEVVKIKDNIIEKTDKGYIIPENTDLKDIIVEVRDLGYNSYKTTADIELNNNKSKVNIIPRLDKEDNEFNLIYKIFDENNREFYADNLSAGKYRLEITKPEEIYEIRKIDGIKIDDITLENDKYIYEFTLDKEPRDIIIDIEKLDAHYVYYWVYDYTKDFNGVKLINQDTNAEINLDLVVGQNGDNYVGAKAFSKLIPYGTYKAEFDADKENYEFEIYREFNKGNGINDKEKADNNLVVDKDSKLNTAGNISFGITPEKKNYTININGEGKENAEFKIGENALDFDRSIGTEIKSISKNLPINVVNDHEVEPGDYAIAAIADEGYYAEPGLYLLELRSSRVTAFPSKAEYKLIDRNVDLQMDIKKSKGNGSLIINDNIDNKQNYIVQDVRGYFGLNNKIYTDLDNLPEGNYIITAVVDENTENTTSTINKFVKISSGESTTADFKFEPIDTETEGFLIVESKENINVKIKNVKTGNLVDPVMEFEENGIYNYWFTDMQGVYELIINDGDQTNFDAPKYFVMTEESIINITKNENPIEQPIDQELEKILVELKILLEKAKSIDEDKYTEKSVNALKESLSKIKESYTNIDDAKNAIETLKSVYEALEEKTINEETKPEDPKPIEPENPKPIDPNPAEPKPSNPWPVDPGVIQPDPRNPEPIKPVKPIEVPYSKRPDTKELLFVPGIGEIFDSKSKIPERNKNIYKKDYGIELPQKFSSLEFTDITLSQKEVVDFVSSHKIMIGNDEGEFEPDTQITRAMLVETLRRISKDKTIDKKVTFNDVEENQWYTESVYWATSHGYVIGDDKGNFNPNDTLTRQELALILDRFLKTNNISLEKTQEFKFKDEDSIPKWSIDSVKNMVETSLVEGENKENYNPISKVSRYELARALKIIVDWSEKH